MINEKIMYMFGPKGLPGCIGAKGSRGKKGDVGDRGLFGNIGTTGDKGNKGEKGTVKGSKGPKGPQGIKGDIGINAEYLLLNNQNIYTFSNEETVYNETNNFNIRYSDSIYILTINKSNNSYYNNILRNINKNALIKFEFYYNNKSDILTKSGIIFKVKNIKKKVKDALIIELLSDSEFDFINDQKYVITIDNDFIYPNNIKGILINHENHNYTVLGKLVSLKMDIMNKLVFNYCNSDTTDIVSISSTFQ